MDPTTVLSGVNALLCAFIVAIVGALREAFPAFFRSPTGRRVLPLLPLVFGCAFGAAGLCDTRMFGNPNRLTAIVVGGLCGALASSAKTALNRFKKSERDAANPPDDPARPSDPPGA